jgi:DNA-binding NarL/FixJ family response regulator
MNILYVENHATFATDVTRRFLSQHTVTIVPSLAGAREALATDIFQVALVDYDLDDGKGDELVREIHAQRNHTIVIAVSSHEDGNAALLRAGASSVCSKMQFDRIQNVIESVTGGPEPQ